MEWEADIPGLGDPAHFDFIFSLIGSTVAVE